MELIDRYDLYDSTINVQEVSVLAAAILTAPIVGAVRVVRCGECIYYEKGKCYEPYCDNPNGGLDNSPKPTDFCSYGEPRTPPAE